MFYKAVANYFNVSIDTPVKDLPKQMLDMVLYGTNGEKLDVAQGAYHRQRQKQARQRPPIEVT